MNVSSSMCPACDDMAQASVFVLEGPGLLIAMWNDQGFKPERGFERIAAALLESDLLGARVMGDKEERYLGERLQRNAWAVVRPGPARQRNSTKKGNISAGKPSRMITVLDVSHNVDRMTTGPV